MASSMEKLRSKDPSPRHSTSVGGAGSPKDAIPCRLPTSVEPSPRRPSAELQEEFFSLLITGQRLLAQQEPVLEILEQGLDPDAKSLCGVPALVMASKFGLLRVVERLLLLGADVEQQDPYWHTAWYYVCFSKDLSRTQKVELGRLLLQHRGDELCTPEGLLMVAYTDLYEVGVPLLDLLQYEILSKCANLTKVVEFFGLHKLDAAATITWPDGSATTTVPLDKFVEKGHKAFLTHPAVRALLTFRWRSFGLALYRWESRLYGLVVAAASAVMFLMTVVQPPLRLDSYSAAPEDILRLGLELVVVVGTAVEFGTSMRNVPASGGLRAAMGPGQLMTTGAVAGVALARALGLRPIMQARCMSLCILLLWLRVFDVAALSCRYVGPFFLMVLDMVRQVEVFFLILMVLLPGFSLALGVLGVYHDVPGPAPSAATARPGDAQLDFSRLQALQLVLLMMGSGDWESAEVDWMANGVFVLFLFMSPVLALNILVAMMADTYARVTEQAHVEWIGRWGRFLSVGQHRVPPFVARFSPERAEELLTPAEKTSRASLAGNQLQRSASFVARRSQKGYYLHVAHEELFEEEASEGGADGAKVGELLGLVQDLTAEVRDLRAEVQNLPRLSA